MKRVVSLLPSATEIVCALDQPKALVGRSHECDFPPEVQALPVCTRTRINPDHSGEAIHRQVEETLGKGLSLFEVDLEVLQRVRPEIVLTQAQCEVCAISLAEVERQLADRVTTQPKVISLSPRKLSELWPDIAVVAEALGVPSAGRDLTKRLKNRMADVILKTAALRKRPSVACIEWFEPLMAAGNWIPELVDLAGGRNLLGVAGEHSPRMDWAELVSKDPDIVVLMPCGFGLERTCQEADALTRREEWKGLRAVQSRSVYAVDGNHYFNRPGPRLVDSLEILAEILHPGLFPPQYKRQAWRRFAPGA